jgi:translocation and assembly module TamB
MSESDRLFDMTRMRSAKRLGVVAALVAVGLSLLLASTLMSRSADNDKGILADLISRALSTPATRISIGDVSGILSSSVTVHDIKIADRDGVWLELDSAQLVWTRSALLFRRLEIDKLDVGNLTIRRKPVPSQEAVSDAPLFPELPLKVDVKEFALKQLALGAPLLGVDAKLGATGSASIGAPSEGLSLKLNARRLDAAGTFNTQLAYVPKTNRLSMALAFDEPAGGILVHALKLPDLPPAKLDLKGDGPLDAFTAQLAFDAGPSIGANGAARLTRQGDGRKLTLDLASRIEGLMPSLAKPIFAGTTQLNSTVTFADAGGIAIAPLTVASNTARLDITGTLSQDDVADLAIRIRSVPNAGDKTTAETAEIRNLTFDATVKGDMMGPTVAATLAVEDAKLPQGRLARLTGRFSATPSGAVTDEATAIPVTAAIEASGIEASDPAMARAIGSSLSLSLSGTTQNGIADVKTLKLQTATASASFVGRIGKPVIDGRATIEAPDLSRFGGVASLDLRGALALNAEIQGAPKDGRINAALDGKVTQFATGVASVDGLAGGTVTLKGVARRLPNGGFGFGDVRLNGVNAAALVNGNATAEAAAIDASFTVPDLRHADKRLSGRGEARAHISGTLDYLNADATLAVSDARMLGRPVPRLTFDARATDVTGLIDAHAKLAGTVDNKDARGTVHVARQPDSAWRLDDLDVLIGSVAARGSLVLNAKSLADGKITVAARDLDDLSPLALTKMAGQIDTDVTLAVTDGGQNAKIAAAGRRLKFGEAAIDKIDANASLTDVWRHPVIDGQIAIDRATVAGEAFSQVRLLSRGSPSASDLTLSAQARGFALDAHGRLVPADNIRFELQNFSARRGNHKITLANPATLTVRDQGIDIRGFALALDRGRLGIEGSVGKTLDLAVNARAVPLSAGDIFKPGLGASGTLDGEAKIGGTSQAPTGTWRIALDKIAAKQTRDLGLPPADVKASGRFAGGNAMIDATVSAQRAGSVHIAGRIPMQGGDLGLAVKGHVDLAVANAQLSTAGRRVTGRADIDLKVGGRIAQPRVDGAATLSGGAFTDSVQGVKLTAITGRIAARGDQLVIDRLSAQTGDSGTLTASGQVRVDPQAGFPGAIKISGHDAALVSNDIVKLVASPSLNLSGPLARDPKITGRIDISRLDIAVPERLPPNLKPLPGTRHVGASPKVRAALAVRKKAQSHAHREPPFDAGLDLVVSAPNRVFVRGRGIDAELGGQLRLSGRLKSPTTIGAFDLRRGRLQIVGTRRDFSRAHVAFTGDLTPDLDLLAQTRAGEVTAQVAVTGPASQPTFAFTSTPDLPQDEVLSQILFSKASGSLSPFQALQLAQAAAQFTGNGGPDTFERIRKSLGVDSLDVSTGRKGDPTVGISRAINNKISVGVKAGASTEDSGVTLDLDLTKQLRIQGEADANGGTALGVGTEIEY